MAMEGWRMLVVISGQTLCIGLLRGDGRQRVFAHQLINHMPSLF